MSQPTPFPVSLETAWRELMKTLAVSNVAKAQQTNIAAKGVRQLMRRG